MLVKKVSCLYNLSLTFFFFFFCITTEEILMYMKQINGGDRILSSTLIKMSLYSLHLKITLM